MADAEAAMALALADGRVQLTIENRDLGAAVVEHLSVDWPGVSALPAAEPASRMACAAVAAACARRTCSSTASACRRSRRRPPCPKR